MNRTNAIYRLLRRLLCNHGCIFCLADFGNCPSIIAPALLYLRALPALVHYFIRDIRGAISPL